MTGTRIDLGDLSLNVRETGAGATVLFLHGFPEHGGAWARVADNLSDGYRCVLPDQRGYALSDKPLPVEAYRIDCLLDDIDALVDRYANGGRIALAGHDWGGVVAWWYAARHPRRVEKLIIANAPHPAVFQKALIDDPAQRLAAQYITALRAPGAADRFLSGGPEALWDRLFAANPAFDSNDRAAYIATWATPGAIAAMIAWYCAAPFVVPLPGEAAIQPGWIGSEPLSIAVPTLVLWGMRDTALLPVLLDRLAIFVADLTVERFDDAGHAVIHEQPARVAQSIRRFLES